MWRWLLLIVLVVAISAAAAWVSMLVSLGGGSSGSPAFPVAENDTSTPRPALVIDAKPEYEFGVMSQQSKGRHEWVITNEGEGPLVLTGTQPSCSCTVIDPKPDQSVTVEPGTSYTVRIEWETRQYTNKYRKEARILTNDSKYPTIDFIVTGLVEPPVVIVPTDGVINLQTITNDAEQVAPALVYSPDRAEMKIVDVRTTRPELLHVEVIPLTDEEKEHASFTSKSGYKLEVHVRPLPRLGTFREEVIVKTDHPLREEVRFTVAGKVVGPISVTPPLGLRMPDVSSSQGGSGSVVLTVRGQEHTSFTAENPPKGLTVNVVPLDSDSAEAPAVTGSAAAGPVRRYRLDVTVQPGLSPCVIDEPIVLRTDHPMAAEVEVPLYVRVLGQG